MQLNDAFSKHCQFLYKDIYPEVSPSTQNLRYNFPSIHSSYRESSVIQEICMEYKLHEKTKTLFIAYFKILRY